MAVFNIKQGNDYIESYYNKNTDFKIGYYTVKEMKALYPGGGIRVVGQIACGKDEIGTIVSNEIEEVVYKPISSVRYKTIGYIELETGSFIAVKKDNLLAIILLFLAGLLAIVGLAVGISSLPDDNDGYGSGETTTTPSNLDVNQQQGLGELDLPEKVEDMGSKNVTMNGIAQINFKAGQVEQNFILSNSEKNKDICFVVFTIYLDNNENGVIDESDEQLYQSGLVQPGYSVSRFNISRALDAGEYKAIVHQQPYSFDQARTPLNNFVVKTDLIVE
mgnify:CR=1 FL=1